MALEQTVVLQPWQQQINGLFLLGKDQHGPLGVATFDEGTCTLTSADYGNQYALHIKAPNLAQALAKVFATAESFNIFYSLNRDYTRDHTNKAIVFNVIVDGMAKPHGIVGHTSGGQVTLSFTGRYLWESQKEMDTLPVGTIVSFCVEKRKQ
jgi:hypothetical protein